MIPSMVHVGVWIKRLSTCEGPLVWSTWESGQGHVNDSCMWESGCE